MFDRFARRALDLAHTLGPLALVAFFVVGRRWVA
jgi:hypothetical protein